MFKVGDVVTYGNGKRGKVTAVRKNHVVHRNEVPCEHNPETRLPDYVEIDGEIQIHPSRVRRE